MTTKELAILAADEITQRNFSDVFNTLTEEAVIGESVEESMRKAHIGMKDAWQADCVYRKLIEESL